MQQTEMQSKAAVTCKMAIPKQAQAKLIIVRKMFALVYKQTTSKYTYCISLVQIHSQGQIIQVDNKVAANLHWVLWLVSSMNMNISYHVYIYIVYHDYKQKPTPLPHFESKHGFSQAEISQNGNLKFS